jgi:hypothetical protein
MTRKLLFGVALLALVSCLKEEVRPVDFTCLVNGREWQMNNPPVVLFNSDYKIVAYHYFTDSNYISIDANADEGKEVILTSLHIDIKNFKGPGTYNVISDLEVDATAVGKKQGIGTVYTTYVLDESKPCKIIIQEYQETGRMKGIFTVPLKAEFGPDGVNPESINVSYGRFDCPARIFP